MSIVSVNRCNLDSTTRNPKEEIEGYAHHDVEFCAQVVEFFWRKVFKALYAGDFHSHYTVEF